MIESRAFCIKEDVVFEDYDGVKFNEIYSNTAIILEWENFLVYGILELIDKELEEIEERNAKQILFSETVSKKELKRIQMKDRSDLKTYFINQVKEEKYVARQYIRQYEDGYDHLEEDLKPYGLIKRDYKLSSFFTWPGVWDICFFKKDSIDYSEFELYFFTYPIRLEDEYEFEDIGFKSESGLIWLKTCSHENYFEMELTQKQYESFKKIGIAHEIL